MPEKLRSINTKFWNDPYIEELNPSEKLLFLYCLTSPYSNLLGIYEVSQKKISFETGLNQETIRKGFERFGKDSKVFYKGNFIIIPNFLNHQRLNSNMKIGITKIFNDLPEWLRNDVLGNGSEGLGNDSEGFEKIRNGLLKYEIEIGSMKEEEGSKKEGNDSYFDFINLFNQISGRSFKGEEKSKKQFKARLREGWELKDFDIAIKNLYNSDFHKEKNFKYATPELITRSEKLNMHYNSKDDSTSKLDLVEQKYKDHE